MNNHISLKQIQNCLDSLSIPWKKISVGVGYELLITTQGGRVFGPFKGEDDESLFWVNEAFSSPERLKEYLDSGYFHIGGERMWIGPELSFFCDAPELFDATYTVQTQIDPGNYQIEEMRNGSVRLSMKARLMNLRSGGKVFKDFSLVRSFYPAADPLRYMKNMGAINAGYCGFIQEIKLEDESTETPMYLEPWLLTQVNPGGHILVPYLGNFEFVDYYDPVDDSIHMDKDGYVELLADGKRKYKTAYRAANTFGRFAYVNRRENEYYLIVRNYYNDPSEPYCAEPWHSLGERGCSMYFYNDDMSNGGFTELENTCGMVGLDSRRDEYTGSCSLWVYYGEKPELEKIIKCLLGIDYKITF